MAQKNKEQHLDCRSEMSQVRYSWFSNKKETGHKWHLWESLKAKTAAEHKEYKHSSHLCHKNILTISKTLGKIFCGVTKVDISGAVWSLVASGGNKRGDGMVLVWGCFPASGSGWLSMTDATMKSALYQKMLNENIREYRFVFFWLIQNWTETNQQILLWNNKFKQTWHDLKQTVNAKKKQTKKKQQQQ